MSVWKSDETLLSICILNFSFKNDFVWEEISNIRHSVSSPDETPRSSSKILRCASYFQLSSRCFIWWWNTASHVWYITSNTSNIVPARLAKNVWCTSLNFRPHSWIGGFHCHAIKNINGNLLSLEHGKLKKITIQKALPRIRSVQYFICEIFRKTFYPDV